MLGVCIRRRSFTQGLRKKRFMKTTTLNILVYIAILLLPSLGHADTVCSTVKIEILQQATLERTAFDAKLTVTNTLAETSLEAVRVDLKVRDPLGNDKTDQFFIRQPA